jgi:hypothetical protein
VVESNVCSVLKMVWKFVKISSYILFKNTVFCFHIQLHSFSHYKSLSSLWVMAPLFKNNIHAISPIRSPAGLFLSPATFSSLQYFTVI